MEASFLLGRCIEDTEVSGEIGGRQRGLFLPVLGGGEQQLEDQHREHGEQLEGRQGKGPQLETPRSGEGIDRGHRELKDQHVDAEGGDAGGEDEHALGVEVQGEHSQPGLQNSIPEPQDSEDRPRHQRRLEARLGRHLVTVVRRLQCLERGVQSAER